MCENKVIEVVRRNMIKRFLRLERMQNGYLNNFRFGNESISRFMVGFKVLNDL